MIYTTPDYYKEFSCIADKCKDTCCAGWQIVIDDESLEKYRKLSCEYTWKVMACVDWESETFRQDENKRCSFLNKQNLCDLYTNLGEQSLCKTCKDYPRHTEEFDGVREVTLSISCPEVARIIMERIEPVSYITKENEKEEETEDFGDFDPFLFSIIEDARKEMLSILQDRNLPLRDRAMLVLAMSHDMQGRINRQDMFACSQVIEKYLSKKAKDFIHNYLANQDAKAEQTCTKTMFEKLYELELLREDWKSILDSTKEGLFYSEQTSYIEICRQFQEWKGEHPEMDIHLEQILVYFLFTYFPGGVYDGEVFAKAQMSIYCTWIVELLWMSKWLANDKKLEKEEMIELLYRFSREVEHSDENLKKLDKMMEKKWLL